MTDSNEAALRTVIQSWSEGLEATIAATRTYFADTAALAGILGG